MSRHSAQRTHVLRRRGQKAQRVCLLSLPLPLCQMQRALRERGEEPEIFERKRERAKIEHLEGGGVREEQRGAVERYVVRVP